MNPTKYQYFSLSTCGLVTKRSWIPHTQCWIPHLLFYLLIPLVASLPYSSPNLIGDYLIPPSFLPFTATLLNFASTPLMILVSVYVFLILPLLLEFISSGFCSNFVIGQTVHINISYCCYWFSELKSSLFHRTFSCILCSTKSVLAINLLKLSQWLPVASGADLQRQELHLTDLWVPHPKGLTTVVSI